MDGCGWPSGCLCLSSLNPFTWPVDACSWPLRKFNSPSVRVRQTAGIRPLRDGVCAMKMPDARATSTRVNTPLLLASLETIREYDRPDEGWLRYYRTCLNLSAATVAKRMKVSRHLPLGLEASEAEDAITLRSLRRMAAAMGLDLVYGFALTNPRRERERAAKRAGV